MSNQQDDAFQESAKEAAEEKGLKLFACLSGHSVYSETEEGAIFCPIRESRIIDNQQAWEVCGLPLALVPEKPEEENSSTSQNEV